MKMLGRTILPATPVENELYIVNDWHCPECSHKTITWKQGSQWAGIWECLNEACGASDACEHPSWLTESVQVDLWLTPDIDRSYEREIYVCEVCRVDIPLDEADPAIDAFEAEVDRQIDFARGK